MSGGKLDRKYAKQLSRVALLSTAINHVECHREPRHALASSDDIRV